MPPAKLWLRALALGLDLALLIGISFIICARYTLPIEFPEAATHWHEYWQTAELWAQNSGMTQGIATPMPSDELIEIYQHCFEVLFFCTWIYFAAGESLLRGRSLGKLTCRIRTISTITLTPPSLFGGIVRGGSKTLVLLFMPMLMLPATLIALRFNKRSQMGHDLLNRSVVIDEQLLPQTDTPDE